MKDSEKKFSETTKKIQTEKKDLRNKIAILLVLLIISIVNITLLIVILQSIDKKTTSITETSIKTTITKTLECPVSWDLVEKSGFCFKLFKIPNMTFFQALSYCPEQQPTSYLAEITTDEELGYLNSKIKQDVWVLIISLYRFIIYQEFYSITVRGRCISE